MQQKGRTAERCGPREGTTGSLAVQSLDGAALPAVIHEVPEDSHSYSSLTPHTAEHFVAARCCSSDSQQAVE